MTRQQLVQQIFKQQSYLCVGLDTDVEKLPQHLRNHPDGIVEFNRQIIDATKDYCVAYKINTAFYEALGVRGWQALEKTVACIPGSHFKIADAKRGDIGNTAAQYAKAFFDTFDFDAVTVAPYMGEDSLAPFFAYNNKCTIVLALTSNNGAADFEMKQVICETDLLEEGVHVTRKKTQFLYQNVMETVAKWGSYENLMFVVGATQPAALAEIRTAYPEHFLLVPGIGAQGGSLQQISEAGITKSCGLLVNASRAIIYAAGGNDFAIAAAAAAQSYTAQMKPYLKL